MDYSRKISERLWNQPEMGALESRREQTFIDDIVQKSHIEKELLANLDGVQTAFDGGAGSGRFSILLARHGIKVTHFDLSQPMIDQAKKLAEEAGVSENITFIKGSLEELDEFADQAFDLAMSFDAPISYTYPQHEEVIKNLVRMAKKRIMISVSSRLGSLPYLSNPLQKNQFILDPKSDNAWVQLCLKNRSSMIESFAFNRQDCFDTYNSGFLGDPEAARRTYDRGETPWCATYHFMPDELYRILSEFGVQNIALAGPGAFARTIPNEILVKIMNDEKQRRDFLEFCHMYDSNIYVCGMGKDNLFAKGEIHLG